MKIALCRKCGRKLKPDLLSLKTGVCMRCRLKAEAVIKAEAKHNEAKHSESKVDAQVEPQNRYIEELWPDDAAAFGGHKWGSPSTNPVG